MEQKSATDLVIALIKIVHDNCIIQSKKEINYSPVLKNILIEK